MSQSLAFSPVRAQLSHKAASSAAFILLNQESKEEQTALTISLLHGSWCVGQMTLAAALRHMRSMLRNCASVEIFATDSLWQSVHKDGEPSSAETVVSTLVADLRTGQSDESFLSIFSDACDKLQAKLSLPADSTESRHALNCLLALPPAACPFGVQGAGSIDADSGQGDPAQDSGPAGPRIFVLPTDVVGRMHLLGQLVGNALEKSSRPSSNPTGQEEQEEQEGASTSAERLPCVAKRPEQTTQIFARKDVFELLEQVSPQDNNSGEENKKQVGMLRQMANEMGVRPMGQFANPTGLQELYERFPHFSPVLDFVKSSLALGACGEEGAPAYVPPILLRGAPGSGKTYFAQELARVLNTPFIERDLSVTSAAMVISGSDSTWKNAKPGCVFEALVNGHSANPLILLNEVDKAATGGQHSSAIAPLYALLEPTSALRFMDEFIPVPVNASKVIWVLTANDGHIPAPIISRLEVFEIPEPTRAECEKIAHSVWESVCERALPKGHGFPEKLSPTLLEKMSLLSPRVMRKALTHAASQAAMDGRKMLLLEDLDSASKRYAPAERKSLGFV